MLLLQFHFWKILAGWDTSFPIPPKQATPQLRHWGFWLRVCIENGSRICFLILSVSTLCSTQKMKFSIKDFFSKCDQIRLSPRILSHFLKKSLMGNFIFCVVLQYVIVLYSTLYKYVTYNSFYLKSDFYTPFF